MLTSVHIRGFRSCKDVRLDNLVQTVALVGRNGAGKSNILQAIAQAAEFAAKGNSLSFFDRMEIVEEPAIDLEFKIGGSDYKYSMAFKFLDKRRLDIEESLSERVNDQWSPFVTRMGGSLTIAGRQDPIPLSELTGSLLAIAKLLPSEDDAVIKIKPLLAFLSAVKYYPLDEPTIARQEDGGIISKKQHNQWLANFEATGNAGDSIPDRIVHLFKVRPDDFRALNELIGPNGLGLVSGIRVLDVPIPEDATNAAEIGNGYFALRFILGPSTSRRSLQVQYASLSSGTRRVLRILTSMVFDKSTVLLLEQPEDSLHQGMTKKVIGLLKSNCGDSQIVASSHSSAIINSLSPESVRLIYLEGGYTRARELSQEEKTEASRYMSEEGSLYDFIRITEES